MSKVQIVVPYENLLELSSSESRFNDIYKFLKNIKLALAYKISLSYNIDMETSIKIVRIKIRDDSSVSVGVESPSTYGMKYSSLVSKILIDDLGSLTEKKIPTNKLSAFCNSVSNSIELLWLDFMRGR